MISSVSCILADRFGPLLLFACAGALTEPAGSIPYPWTRTPRQFYETDKSGIFNRVDWRQQEVWKAHFEGQRNCGAYICCPVFFSGHDNEFSKA
jgi:hypothetical protein